MRNYFPLTVRCQKRECNREEFAQQSVTDFFYSPLHKSRNQSRRKSASVIQIDRSLLDVTRHGNESVLMGERKRKICMTSIARLLIAIACRFHSIAHSGTPSLSLAVDSTVNKLLNWETWRGFQFKSLRYFLCKSFDLLYFFISNQQ